MKNYLKLLNAVMNNGWNESVATAGREGCDSSDGSDKELIRLIHAPQLRFVLGKGFPILTTRELNFDQIKERAFNLLFKTNSDEVTKRIQNDAASNNVLTREGGLPLGPGEPERCQFTTEQSYVHCALTIDSVNVVTDLPNTIAAYAVITHLLCRESIGKYEGELVINIGRAFVRHRHFDVVTEQINKRPQKLCKFKFNPDRSSFKDSCLEDITLEGYRHWDAITIPE